mmetsp:Transcript_10692/g.16224  ORF Transcript_10692/g.16224 Transcript_10692/m.16224 type:complete len:121 (-) Transcript_10692:359-721(-)
MIPQRILINQNTIVPLVVLNVSSSLPSVLILRARKKRKDASLVPQIATADEESVTRAELVVDSSVGKEATANAPVPRRSKCKCEPVRREMPRPKTFVAAIIAKDWYIGALLKMISGPTDM